MAYLKLQQSRAINVIPEDGINIPSPSAVSADGVNESAGDVITDGSKTFKKSVKVGDTVYNTTTNHIAIVVSVNDDTEITVSANMFNIGDSYKIFSTVDVRTEPCVLYVGYVKPDSLAYLTVMTADGDIVTLANPAQGFVLPVQVVRVLKTGTENVDNIIALW